MPIIKDPKTGQYVVQGAIDNTPAQLEPIKEKKKPKPKPWWQKVVNDLSYEVKRIQQDPIKAAQTYQQNVTKAAVKGTAGMGVAEVMNDNKPLNNIKYELKQLSNPERVVPRLLQYGARRMGGEHVANTLTLGGIQAAANIGRNVLDAGEGSYLDKGGQFIDDMVDEAYRANAQLPPSEMTQEQKAGDDARASLVLNLGLAVGTAGVGNALQGTRFIGPAVSALQKAFNPAQAKTLVGGVTRVLAGLAAEEVLSTPLDDNTGGSAVQLLGLLGLPEEQLRQLDPVKPGMTRTEASAAAFVPNVLAAGGMVGSFAGGARLFSGLTNVKRARTTETMRSRRLRERDRQKAAGLIIEDEATGQTTFTPETLQAKPAEPVEAPVEAPVAAGETQGDLLEQPPAKQPSPVTDDPTEIEYDPDVPESDAFGEALDELDDEQLIALNAQEGELVQRVDETLRTPGNGFNPDAREELVLAPADRLAEQGGMWADRLGQVQTDDLLSLASPDNSPLLAERIAVLTGKTPDQFTRADVLDGLRSLEGDGLAVIPSRLMGDKSMFVSDISVDPKRFQFKDNVDVQGQQKGNSLSGVARWNPDLEGRVQVWRDLNDGNTYVVNGHNRVAKAKEMGIPSLRVEYLDAGDAETAMAQGAMINIAQGGGTPFDAAKFFRSRGITDAAQLKDMGIPLKSGLATQGLALSKLPPNIFNMAVSGELPIGRAIALGESGLDPEGMGRVLNATSGRDMTERAFTEVVMMARTAPEVQDALQGGLFGAEMMDTITMKADLAAKIRAELVGNKNLFRKVAKKKASAKLKAKTGTEVNQTGTVTAADVAETVLAEFDNSKYMTGTPVAELLNAGTEAVANGAKPADVVQDILQKLERAAGADAVEIKAPQSADPGEVELNKYGFNEAQQAKYDKMSPEELQAEYAKAEKYQLSDAQRANRQEKLAAMNANDELVSQFVDEMPGSNSANELTEEAFQAKYGTDESQYPQLTKKANLNRVTRDLDRDDWAQRFIRWFDDNVDEQRLQLSPEQRDALKSELIAKAAQNGEVRPPSSPMPEMPKDSGVSLDKVAADLESGEITEDVIKALDDELRLEQEFKDLDAQMEGAVLAAKREEIGYDQMPVEEKKANGMVGGTVPELPPAPIEIPPAASRKITARTSEGRVRGAAESLISWTMPPGGGTPLFTLEQAMDIVRRKGAILDVDKVPGVDLDAALNDKTMGIRDTPATDAVVQAYRQFYLEEAAPQQVAAPPFKMPTDLAKSAPRFGMAQLVFESDLDRAAYMLRDASKKSKGEDRLIAALEASGHDIAAIRRLGGEVKKRIQDGIQEATGSRRAPQESMKIEIPASEQELSSIEGAQEIKSYGIASFEDIKAWVPDADLRAVTEAWGKVEAEIVDEIKRITGDDVKVELNWSKKIGVPSAGWNAKEAREIYGQYNFIADSIHVHDMLNRPVGELLSTGYHEAFHRFQYGLMTPQEMEVLDSAWGVSRTKGLAKRQKIAPIEMQAVAFQKYAMLRLDGVDPMSQTLRDAVAEEMARSSFKYGPPGKAERWAGKALEVAMVVFERMWRVVDRLNNLVRGRGFQTVDDIYEKLFQGVVAKNRVFDSALEAITDDQLVRMDFIEKWQGKPGAALNSVEEAIADINRQIETEQAVAMAGGC